MAVEQPSDSVDDRTRRRPTYGAGQHYLGDSGREYLAYQRRTAEVGAALNARKFAPYIGPTDTVLDFGCGIGATLAQLDCAHRLGVEINDLARLEAHKRGIACVSDLSEIADGSVDVVISNHALEHVPYPIDALRQMRQKLREGGTLVLCVPLSDWRNEKRYRASDPNHHLQTWTPLLLGNTLTEAGFAVTPDDIRIFTHAWSRRFTRLDDVLPRPAFDRICWGWAVIRRARQLIAVVQIKGPHR